MRPAIRPDPLTWNTFPQFQFRVAVAVGDDVLRVEGIRIEANGAQSDVQAVGWVSAIYHHYDAECYDPETGQLRDDAIAREMETIEVEAYGERLLREQNSEGAAP